MKVRTTMIVSGSSHWSVVPLTCMEFATIVKDMEFATIIKDLEFATIIQDMEFATIINDIKIVPHLP